MTEDERPPAAHQVEIAIPIDVPNPRPLAARDEWWCPADGTISANRTVDPAWDQALRRIEEFPRTIGAYVGSSLRPNASVITVVSRGGLGLS